MTLEEWRTSWRERGGLAARFRCPACGHVASGADFVAVGSDATNAPVECLGRVLSPRAPGADRTARPGGPCDWAAYGFLGTMGEGIRVVTPDGGNMESFPFAD